MNAGGARPTPSGFTLIEVLVALAILAVALAAAARASATATDSAREVRNRTLATWVAQNQITEVQTAIRLVNKVPNPGRANGSAEMAGARFVWQQTVSETPNPAFHKLEVGVTLDGDSTTLVKLTSYLFRAPTAGGA